MAILLYTIHIVVSLFLILVVLLQQGKGADLSVFGGGGTMTAFGARGAASVLHKLTVGGFVVFIITTLTIGVYQTGPSDNVLSTLPPAEAAETDANPDALSGVLPEAENFSDTEEGEGTEATEGDTATSDPATSDPASDDATATPDTGAGDTTESGN